MNPRPLDRTTAPETVSLPGAPALVAEELAEAYANDVAFQIKQLGLSSAEAIADAAGLTDVPAVERLQRIPPTRLSGLDLAQLAQQAPDQVATVWAGLVRVAQEELASGQRAARTLREQTAPYERAQFLALRASFRAQWQPQGGIEDALIDSLALAYTNYLTWSARLHVLSTTEAKHEDGDLSRTGEWSPPRVETAAWIEQAAAMMERFHRLFLRTLRALQDYRRGPAPRVAIGTAGQVNVGTKQLNVGAAAAIEEATGA
jgi:hypothetical protein